MLELGTAQTDADFDDAYRFWYDIYVGEMGRHLNDPNTSHEHRRLYDPLATAGSLCIARREGQVVGTVLSTPIANPTADKYRTLYGLTDLSAEENWATAITTKLMVAAPLRKTRLPLRLAFATYNWGLHVGIKHNYIDCNDHLVRLFSRLGYQEHLPSLFLKEYGAVNSLRLDITDEEHLRKVASPFLPALQRFLREQGLPTGDLDSKSPAQENAAQVPPAITQAFDRYRPHPIAARLAGQQHKTATAS